jgi:hypothetical protein
MDQATSAIKPLPQWLSFPPHSLEILLLFVCFFIYSGSISDKIAPRRLNLYAPGMTMLDFG